MDYLKVKGYNQNSELQGIIEFGNDVEILKNLKNDSPQLKSYFEAIEILKDINQKSKLEEMILPYLDIKDLC